MTYTFLLTSPKPGYRIFLEKELEAEVIVQRNYKRAARIVEEVDISGIVVPLFHYSISDRSARKSIEQHLGRELKIPVFEGWKYEPKAQSMKGADSAVKVSFEEWVADNFMRQASSTHPALP